MSTKWSAFKKCSLVTDLLRKSQVFMKIYDFRFTLLSLRLHSYCLPVIHPFSPNKTMTPDQAQEIIGTLERIAYALEYLGNKQAEAFLSINDKQGVIANSLLQICDKHGSQVPGPY